MNNNNPVGNNPVGNNPAGNPVSNQQGYGHFTSPGRLLVIDDNKVMRLLLSRGLEQEGHSVVMVENGNRGLEMLRAEHFDLVLLDIQMPEMDGFQVLEAITGDKNLREIPVIMTSSLDEIDGVAHCIEMGAEDYLFKPLNPIMLRARIKSSLEKKRLRDRQKELIKKFAASEVADDLQDKGFNLGGQMIEATVMFSDIRSFTTITESQPAPVTIELLNNYYSLMFEAISGHGGVVNQIVGDGIMALFGAPAPIENPQASAVRAALEMIEMVEMFNMDQASRGKVQIKIGIGIATGQVVAGYTGTMQRATYTCVGDTVNLAARLEAYTKVIGQPILISEATRNGLGADLKVESAGPAELKGKTQAVNVFFVPVG